MMKFAAIVIFLAFIALNTADIYDNCGADGAKCFAIPHIGTCLAQKVNYVIL
jgi:hypothetical protein